MKKLLFLIFTFLLLTLVFRVNAKNASKEILFDDMTTKNFIAKSGYLPFHSIKKICSYDFCDYNRGENPQSLLETFTNNYLKTIKDDELKSNFKIKGIKITKIILK